MGIRDKLEAEIDIKSNRDLFHEMLRTKPHEISNISPEKIHACDLHEGQYGKIGSVLCWQYNLGVKKIISTEIVEVDEENKLITFKAIKGDLLDDYRSLTKRCHVIPNGEVTCVKWTLDFGKINDDGPYPTKEMDFLIALTKDIEAHHLKA